MADYLIETQALNRRFRTIIAVKNLDMRVPSGSIYGFLGPNGAGKTTTIRILLGLIRSSSGQVRLFDLPMPQQRLGILRRIGSLVETPSLYSHLTGVENLEIVRRLRGLHPRQIQKVLSIVRMEKDARRLVRGYSLGMKQRLALALALLPDPELLILDEPTNGLDPAGIQEIRTLLQHLRAETGVTILLSSHLLNEVAQVATEVGIIYQGCLVYQGSLNSLQAQGEPYLRLEVDRPDEALRLLQTQGMTVEKDQTSLVLRGLTETSQASLSLQLAKQGIAVLSMNRHTLSLEEIYMRLTKSASNERSL